MAKKFRKSQKGFTLLEAVITMALGLAMIAAAVELYSKSLDATFRVSQRAEMQQDMRAAENMLVKDISLAGAGLPAGGVALATGGSKTPIYGCDQTKCYLGGSPAKGVSFPGGTSPYLYWIIPGYQLGPVITSGQPATDIISVVQADLAFHWSDYTMTMNSTGTQGTITYTPSGTEVTPLVSDSAYGLKTGDLVLVTGKSGGNTINAVGEVTANVTGTGSPYTVKFATPDALGFNQSGATSSSMLQMKSLSGITLTRIWLITYYISSDTGLPTLMRKVNGQSPAPVAGDVVNLQFQYDSYDDNGVLTASASPTSLNQIRKINLLHMTARSVATGVNGYQSMDLQTSVSARNMSFRNSYQ